MKIDAVACAPWYIAHLAPVWQALPSKVRGTFHVIQAPGQAPGRTVGDTVAYARGLGLAVTVGKFGNSDTPALCSATGDLFSARRHGRPVALMEHGSGQSYGGDRNASSHSSYAGGLQRAAELFLHPGPHPAQRDRETYPDARVEVVGSPVLDTLPAYAPTDSKPVVAISFHWECEVCNETRSGFIQYRNAVADLGREKDLKLIGHGHPRMIERLAPWYERHGIEVVRDFGEVCRRASVYACDNSSSLFEFATTGRPVVVLNLGCYRKGVEHGLRFWDAANVGLNVDVPYYLTTVVRQALVNRPDEAKLRERALDLVYPERHGAAERAAAVLVDWLEKR